ncbi:MAG: ribosome maturation factor RimM [Gammaproteobacteria bacterium]|jgi:16S rRNA processing protein RimM|nr:ribosome maturation factor RimM [Gammaproteobacteria bacterium]
MTATASKEFIPVGKIAGVFGIKGWMKVFSYTDPRKNILSYSPLFLSVKGQWIEAKVSNGRIQGKGIVIALDNVTDPEQVLPLIGTALAIKKEQLKPTSSEEFYWSELTGLDVINLDGYVFGQVDSIVETGAHDVLVVKNKELKAECLIPFVLEEIVQKVDLDNGVIEVDWEADY